MPSTHHIAQFNVARMLAPLETATMADFVAGLDPINELADDAPGFVWRMKGEDEGVAEATDVRPYDADTIVTMSVWEDAELLWQFVYRSGHLEYLRRRQDWFEHLADMSQVLWWLPIGTVPTVTEGKARLDHLREHGPTPYAFTFRTRFPQPAEAA
ncbi:DUF3291 domain-containing protein [Embleya sp. NBC_00896]|uniref:DUF3291 domain-containing protein n=1 Tax=Embleya sp. NBC_00896 TaxID=2975961 RepID=UPI002F91A90C|nr:DUF3291 domain-containing protein [Embleya sp. NBC_00896]